MVIMQETPPTQKLFLNLCELTDIECHGENFSFKAHSYGWLQPQYFTFTGDRIGELYRTLLYLLKKEQFLHYRYGICKVGQKNYLAIFSLTLSFKMHFLLTLNYIVYL